MSSTEEPKEIDLGPINVDPHSRPMPYRDSKGRFRTQNLFVENYVSSDLPVFTLKEQDHEYNGVVYPSARRLFLECNDPTGYVFSQKYLGSYQHWLKLTESNAWFTKHLDSWLEELEVRHKALGYQKITEVATGDTGQAFNAAKFLAKEGWEPKSQKETRGRPTKKEVQKNLRIETELEKQLKDDLDRVYN